MNYETSWTAVTIFAAFVTAVLGLSFYLGAKAKSAQGYFAAHGQVHWFVNGIAFAGDYLSAASFLGICGMIAFNGYDGFLYSIGYLAGWIVALLVIAEPLKALGKYTFADALDKRFQSRGIKLAASISTLVVSLFYLIPQMVGAGALVRPLLGMPTQVLGMPSHALGVISVGAVVIVIVVTAGMVSTTWVQFIKGSLLVLFCTIVTAMILNRGLSIEPPAPGPRFESAKRFASEQEIPGTAIPADGGRAEKPLVRVKPADGGPVQVYRRLDGNDGGYLKAQYLTVMPDGKRLVNGLPQGKGEGMTDFAAVGQVFELAPGEAGAPRTETGPVGPLEYLKEIQGATMVTWKAEPPIKEADGSTTTVYAPRLRSGKDLLTPGSSPTFAKVRNESLLGKLDFLSLMLALFGGTASLPHILIRYYTVKDREAARKSTLVGIASIGFFYVLTLYLGLGAMTSGVLDPTNTNMPAPLLARSFGELLFAVISAIAFTTVLGTVSGLILAAAGAVAHDLAGNFFGRHLNDHEKVRLAKISAVVVGVIAMGLGILFEKMNVTFLVGWAFNVAASANLPSLLMLLFWQRTTKQGITASILVGMISSLAWVLLSAEAFKDVYGLSPEQAIVPFSQPAIVTIPLGFAVLIVVSLLTPKREPNPPIPV